MFKDNTFTMNEDDCKRMVAGWLPYQVKDIADHVTRYGLAMLEHQAGAVLSDQSTQSAHEAWLEGDNFTEACQWLADWVDHAQDKFNLHDERHTALEALVKAFDNAWWVGFNADGTPIGEPIDNYRVRNAAKAIVKWLLDNVHYVTTDMLYKVQEAVSYDTEDRIVEALKHAENFNVSCLQVAAMYRWALMSSAFLDEELPPNFTVLSAVTRVLLARNRHSDAPLEGVVKTIRKALSAPAEYYVTSTPQVWIRAQRFRDWEIDTISFDAIPFTFVGNE